MLSTPDHDYLESEILNLLLNDEGFVNIIQVNLRNYISNILKNKGRANNCSLAMEKGVPEVLSLIHEFLEFHNFNYTLSILNTEFNIKKLDLEKHKSELKKLDSLNHLGKKTRIENLLEYSMQFGEKCEIDEITSSALIEASNCIESLQEEINALHNAYLEKVNSTREIMEKKVMNIEQLYLDSINKNDNIG
ncbi:hypothetical protein HWI79_2547 [Cryptosporidium felis]|nr:hypothetical protein HWI79_2547 [Cryptosporidium felis]